MYTGEDLQLRATKVCSSEPPTAAALRQKVNRYYAGNISDLKKSSGSAVYGIPEYMNAMYARKMFAAMLSSNTAFASVGARNYDQEGVRLVVGQPTYGLYEAQKFFDVFGASRSSRGDTFIGLGGMTSQDGIIPEGNRLPVVEANMPSKDLPYSFDFGLMMKALSSKDNNIDYNDYLSFMTAGYTDFADHSILRPVNYRQPMTLGPDGSTYVETSINSIQRCISSGKEVTYCDPEEIESDSTWEGIGLREVTPSMVSPFGGRKGSFYEKRFAGITGSAGGSATNHHEESLYDGQLYDLHGADASSDRPLTLAEVKGLYRDCQAYWEGNTNNKVWLMSNVAADKIAALTMATGNRYLDSVQVVQDFNGIHTVAGRDVGFQVASFQGTPVLCDGNLNFDYGTQCVSKVQYGDVMLLDLNHFWLSVLTPLEMASFDNYASLRQLQERNVMLMRAETHIDKFRCHGRITGIASDNGYTVAGGLFGENLS